MKIEFGRVVRATELSPNDTDDAPTRKLRLPLPRGKVVGREVLDAAAQASALLARAEERALAIVAEAEAEAADRRLRAEAQARADATASLAARFLALTAREAESADRGLDRLVEVARLLAERLLGEELTIAPERIVALARQALAEARGARRVTMVAHPDDAKRLEHALVELGLGGELLRVVADARRPQGNLRLETDIGTLDAELGPQLERLAQKLRETLGHG
jgi:flagellar assembly protein FliH